MVVRLVIHLLVVMVEAVGVVELIQLTTLWLEAVVVAIQKR
jgi:hypothetical protein